jgi:hypothetical protein
MLLLAQYVYIDVTLCAHDCQAEHQLVVVSKRVTVYDCM